MSNRIIITRSGSVCILTPGELAALRRMVADGPEVDLSAESMTTLVGLFAVILPTLEAGLVVQLEASRIDGVVQ